MFGYGKEMFKVKETSEASSEGKYTEKPIRFRLSRYSSVGMKSKMIFHWAANFGIVVKRALFPWVGYSSVSK